MEDLHPLVRFRAFKGLNRTQLSRLTGIGYQTLGQIEKGKSVGISDPVMFALKKIGVPHDLPQRHKAWRERQSLLREAGEHAHAASKTDCSTNPSLPAGSVEEDIPLPYAYDGEETALYRFD